MPKGHYDRTTSKKNLGMFRGGKQPKWFVKRRMTAIKRAKENGGGNWDVDITNLPIPNKFLPDDKKPLKKGQNIND